MRLKAAPAGGCPICAKAPLHHRKKTLNDLGVEKRAREKLKEIERELTPRSEQLGRSVDQRFGDHLLDSNDPNTE